MSDRRDHLLFLSDDDEMRLRCAGELEKLDNRVSVAASIVDANGFLSNEKVDLVLVDAAIATTDGQGELSNLFSKAAQEGIASIILAGANELGDVSRFIEMGATDYLIDPYNQPLLALRVQATVLKKIDAVGGSQRRQP